MKRGMKVVTVEGNVQLYQKGKEGNLLACVFFSCCSVSFVAPFCSFQENCMMKWRERGRKPTLMFYKPTQRIDITKPNHVMTRHLGSKH